MKVEGSFVGGGPFYDLRAFSISTTFEIKIDWVLKINIRCTF